MPPSRNSRRCRLLTRPTERRDLIGAAQGLRFLVLDELHTYRGRQGADVALLVRRLRDACAAPNLQCVGTSATMATTETFAEARDVIAKVASRLFGADVSPDHVIGETLVRATGDRRPTGPELLAAMDLAGSGRGYAELSADPLASWIESEFGLSRESGTGHLIRRKPTRVAEASDRLAGLTGRPPEDCAQIIEKILQEGAKAQHPETGRPLFAFRLHQFLSKGDTVYVSLEPETTRHITSQYQVSVPGQREKMLFPLAFCRECGQEYLVVARRKDGGLEARQEANVAGGEVANGYLYISSDHPWPDDPVAEGRLPDSWLEPSLSDSLFESAADGGTQIRAAQRVYLPREIWLGPGGAEVPAGAGQRAWYFREPFKFCLRCRVSYEQPRAKDFAKLATFASEGRSSAMSLISTSIVRNLRQQTELDEKARKLLTFVDNRQDASLQAGHLNDFVQVTQVRGALFRAAEAADEEGLRHDDIAQRVVKSLDLPLAAFAQNPDVKFGQREHVLKALRGALSYLIYADLARGWRITMPNLEQTGLLRFDYVALDEIAADDEYWSAAHPVLRDDEHGHRAELARIVLDEMRRALTNRRSNSLSADSRSASTCSSAVRWPPVGSVADRASSSSSGTTLSRSIPPPTADEVGDNTAAGLLRTALRIGFTSGAGPFRSLASIAVEPRQYQLVPLLLALRMPTVRLLIGDDVGIGKTVESGLIAKELLERGEAGGLTVLCSPALAEQWQAELRDKFAIEATLVLPSTATRLERELRLDESIFDRHPVTVVSLDFIKSDRRYQQFVRTCPDLVIVDEAHTCVAAGSSSSRQSQLRYRLLQEFAADATRHLLLVTATPHSGKEDAFRDLIGLLDPTLADLNLEEAKGREALARHFVQRRRRDIRRYLDQDTPFPKDRQTRDVSYALTGEYGKLARQVLVYARETVRKPGSGLRQRVSWWSALALLRSVASSPRAAATTLETRSAAAAAETEPEADELGRSSVLDLTDEEALEGIDAAAGGRTGEDDDGDRLRRLARAFRKIEGPQDDAKLAALIGEVKALLADGYDPIVFCRFIPTAEYVAEHLAKALGKKAHVRHVTGQLPPEARQQAIEDLAGEPGRHVLVATDCLSEGVNLQENFQAVIHYDLAWNPTRHEQREGRVDRFGQRNRIVRAVTIYGLDNGIDGVVLDVLIRKHRTIAKQTGVAVPVPTGGDDVIKALIEGLLLRGDDNSDQLDLDFGVTKTRDQMHRAWESAAERESKALTKYAHSGVKVEEVRQEVDEIRAALGGSADVSRFTREALSGFGAIIDARPDGFRADTRQLPVSVRHALGLSFEGRAAGAAAGTLDFHPDIPAPPRSHALVRTDPMVRTLARTVLDTALEGSGPARRCGVIRTEAVASRTVLLLVRFRFHVTLPGRTDSIGNRTIIAEDAQVIGYRAGAGGREWLTDDEVAALLTSRPENTLPELVRRTAERVIAELVTDGTGDLGKRELAPEFAAALKERGDALTARLAESHQRVRGAIGAGIRGLKVTANHPADVLGVYVYLPAGGGR
ncbi:helicase-related protein [Sphaerimonospora cavernae]|uniref:Helicase-related protein n=1 Tax=Sphaerimonospora cavernae TaxID=1740611 RepID=A0ABV6U731_9ACTN